ncbi:MAG TPA: acyl-CoA dehydrogenase family protein, partial [Polyangia bacterium]
MLDFTDEQKMAQKMLRQWTDKELAPHVAKMEKGEILPYDIMRKLIAAFGMEEMVRAQFKKLEERDASAGGDKSDKSSKRERDGLGDPGLMAIVSMELS